MVAGRGRGRGRGRGGRIVQRGTHSTPLEEPLPTPQSTSLTTPQSTPLPTPQSPPLPTPPPSSSNDISSKHGSSSLQITENGSSVTKKMICPRGEELLPYKLTTRKIGLIIKTKYDEPWSCWAQVPEDVKKMWFEEFKKSFTWADRDQDDVLRLFRRKGSQTLRTSLADIRRERSDGKWLSKNVLTALKEKWKTDEKFKGISEQNKKNIALNKDGRVNHSGAISISEHMRRQENELGREVSIPEIFEKLNYDKTKEKWKTPVAEQTYDSYKKLQESKISQGEEVDDSILFLEANGGKNKRGRSFGFGSEAPMYTTAADSSSNSWTRPSKISNSEVDELKTRLGAMEETLQKVLGLFEKMAGASNPSSSSNNLSSSINNVMNSIRKDIGVVDDCHANDDDDEYIDEEEVEGEEGGNDAEKSVGNDDMQ